MNLIRKVHKLSNVIIQNSNKKGRIAGKDILSTSSWEIMFTQIMMTYSDLKLWPLTTVISPSCL